MVFNQIIQEVYTHYYLIQNTHGIGQLLFLFFLFSILGWLLETVYRTFRNRRLINPGFLKGPVVPLYGVSGIFILITYLHAHHYSLVLRVLFYFFAITFLEYFTGEVMLRLFKKRLWDYRDDRMNFRGHICVPFSIAWAILSIIYEQILYPFSVGILLAIPDHIVWACNGIALTVFLVDVIYSSRVLGFLNNPSLRYLNRRLRMKRFASPLRLVLPSTTVYSFRVNGLTQRLTRNRKVQKRNHEP